MALGQCRECGKEVSDSAKVCPSCGIKTPIRKSVTTIQAIVVIVIGVWILSRMMGTGSNHTTTTPATASQIAEQKANADRNDAKWKAKEFVEATLKAPSTAIWPNYNEFAAAPESGEPGIWKVAGYVDSQNSFGAMLRNEFLVTMKKNGESWELIEVWFKKK